MKYSRLLLYPALLVALLFNSGCIRKRDGVPSKKDVALNKEVSIPAQTLKGSGKLYFVPLGDFPADVVADLASFYRDKYKLEIETLHRVPLLEVAVNRNRDQLIAEQTIAIMKQANPKLANDPQAIMIGLTNQDMYIAQKDWQFAFGWRDGGKYAVVSSARMALPNGRRTKITDKLIVKRLRKMVTKNIGILYYRLAQSDDRRSVLYRNVGGIQELDYMSEDF